MSVLSVSSLSIQAALTTSLQREQATLTKLTEQLATSKKNTDLTDYTASEARNLINLQSTATQRQAYINVIATASNMLNVYDITLTDLETIATQAQSLANNNPTYSASVADNILAQANNYLKSVQVDLNQQVNGRYVFSGSRYDTAPVQELAAMSTDSLSATTVGGTTVASYDVASTLTTSISGQDITISGTVNANAAQSISATVNGTTYTYNVLTTDTPTTAATGLAALLTLNGIPTTSSGTTVSVGAGNSVDATSTSTNVNTAYVTDKATIDSGYTVDYGITSNEEAFQELIAGLRYLQAAGNATDEATYKAYIQQASDLLTSAITSLQTLHTSVANDINIMDSKKTAQKAAISDLTDQVADIQEVNITQVSAEITFLETILQASYSATGSILKLSLTNYL